jgi:hypothetical protein
LLRRVPTGDIADCASIDSDLYPNGGYGAQGAVTTPTKPNDVAASLIRWLLTDSRIVTLIDGRGIRLYRARIAGGLDLSNQNVLVPLKFHHCYFTDPIDLSYSQLRTIELSGSRIGALNGDGLDVKGDVTIDDGFEGDGEFRLMGAHIGGDLDANHGRIRNSASPAVALNADRLRVDGAVLLRHFNTEGEISIRGAHIASNFHANSAVIAKTEGVAIDATGTVVMGSVLLSDEVAEGEVRFFGSYIGGDLHAGHSEYAGGESSGLLAAGATIKGTLYWNKMAWKNNRNVTLDLTDANVGTFDDDDSSRPSHLRVNGFTYHRISGSIDQRLRWLKLQLPATPSGLFFSQPYRAFADVLEQTGDHNGATQVLVAMEDARRQYGGLGLAGSFWSWVLKLTIDYGYRPLRAIWWITAFVAVGTCLFSWGNSAGVITQIEKDQPQQYRPFHSFVYSLETFLPLVDLRQGKHWLPNPEIPPQSPVALLKPFARGALRNVLGYQHQFGPKFGKHLRWYFWIHVLAGWFFTLMLVAGLSGLVRRG